jgi:hypothetical protein
MTPDDFWPSLETDSLRLTSGDLIARRVFAESTCDIRLAVQAPGCQRLLLVMLDQRHVPMNVELPSAKGFGAERVTLPSESHGRIGIAVKLTDASYRDVFSTLTQDIAEVLAKLRDESLAFRTLVNRLKVWQGFMQKSGLQGLEVVDQIGLYGELRFLHDQLIPRIGVDQAVASWTGPDGTPQDFQCGSIAIEVKTTAAGHHFIRVSNALQLDNSTVESLFLAHFSVDRRNAFGQTLVDLVGQVRSTVESSPESSQLFAARLLQIGYLDAHADHYRQFGYVDRQWHAYRVEAGFPRIELASLRPGVQEVQYTIQVATLLPFEIPLSRIAESLPSFPQ